MTIADVIAAQAGHDGAMATPDGPRAGQPKRRTFTADYKRRVLDEYENAGPGERGALLRREGLYSSHISDWRRSLDAAASGSLAERKPGRPAKDPAMVENERLRQENEKLAAELCCRPADAPVVGRLTPSGAGTFRLWRGGSAGTGRGAAAPGGAGTQRTPSDNHHRGRRSGVPQCGKRHLRHGVTAG